MELNMNPGHWRWWPYISFLSGIFVVELFHLVDFYPPVPFQSLIPETPGPCLCPPFGQKQGRVLDGWLFYCGLSVLESNRLILYWLTHRGWVMCIGISKLGHQWFIYKGLLSVCCQGIIGTNAGLWFIDPLLRNFSQFWTKVQQFSYYKKNVSYNVCTFLKARHFEQVFSVSAHISFWLTLNIMSVS